MNSTQVVFGMSLRGTVLPCCITRSFPCRARGSTKSSALKKGWWCVPRLTKIKDRSVTACPLIDSFELRPLNDKHVRERVDKSTSKRGRSDPSHRFQIHDIDPKQPANDGKWHGHASTCCYDGLYLVATYEPKSKPDIAEKIRKVPVRGMVGPSRILTGKQRNGVALFEGDPMSPVCGPEVCELQELQQMPSVRSNQQDLAWCGGPSFCGHGRKGILRT